MSQYRIVHTTGYNYGGGASDSFNEAQDDTPDEPAAAGPLVPARHHPGGLDACLPRLLAHLCGGVRDPRAPLGPEGGGHVHRRDPRRRARRRAGGLGRASRTRTCRTATWRCSPRPAPCGPTARWCGSLSRCAAPRPPLARPWWSSPAGCASTWTTCPASPRCTRSASEVWDHRAGRVPGHRAPHPGGPALDRYPRPLRLRLRRATRGSPRSGCRWWGSRTPGSSTTTASGWDSIPPTRPCRAASHVEVGFGRDYTDVAPLKGIYTGSGGSEMFVSVEMTRLT